MKGLLEEILEIPDKAKICYLKNKDIRLLKGVPFLGMGSSYFAPLTLFYCGKDINPQIASEYYWYLAVKTQPSGVLISQSGETSETLWNLERFRKIIAVTNNSHSSLAKSRKTQKLFQLYAGEEKFPSTKTFINTLIVLYLGLGIDPLQGIRVLERDFDNFEETSKKYAEKIFKYIKSSRISGLYIIGSGPNIGTAYEGALVLSETTKLAWVGMSVAEYDHGPKEAAQNSVVIILNSHGKDRERISAIKKKISAKSNALIIELVETKLSERLSPLTFITRLNFIMNYLADNMGIKKVFEIGDKITSVSDAIK